MKIVQGLLASSLLFTVACQSVPQFRAPNPSLVRSNMMRSLNLDATTIPDDSDLSHGFRPQSISRLEQESLIQGPEKVFRTQQLQAAQPLLNAQNLEIQGRFKFEDQKGQLQAGALATASLFQGSRKVASTLTAADGSYRFQLPAAGEYKVVFHFENPRWKISKYSWEGPKGNFSQASNLGDTLLEPGSENGKVGWIHHVYLKSMALFEREQVNLDWWKYQIDTIWPARGDYYVGNTVNLTGAEQWDVNGHEIGHAIYAQALNASSRGGFHKIDECYNGTLALSEGFATFFSGAVHLEKNDPDARFDEYLVPRRAPIRVENVPDDVCPGSRNEWRVASAFWEIYDTHSDGKDSLQIGLSTIFNALGRHNRPRANDALDAFERLKEVLPVEAHAQLRDAFQQNTMEVQ